MGATSSRSRVSPVVVASWTEAQLSDAIKELGPAYEAYGQACVENGITGEVLLQTDEALLPEVLQDLGVKTVHKTRLTLEVKKLKESGTDTAEMENAADESRPANSSIQTANAPPSEIVKAFAAFLSHYKLECGTEARLVQLQLKPIIEKNPFEASSHEVFLDSDDLSDLRNLLQHVMQTKVLVLLQTKSVLARPWVIIELFTAITHDVPIVALNVQNANPYNYGDAENFLMHFDEEIDIANPGAAQLLIDMGIDPVDVAWRLSDCLPNIISTDFNPNASEKVLQASLEDLVTAMRKALPIAPSMSKEEWLEKRKTHKRSVDSKAERKVHGAKGGGAWGEENAPAAGSTAGLSLADVPATVPELPNAYLVRAEDLLQLKAALLSSDGSSAGNTSLTSKEVQKKRNKVGAHGMGGVGKTTIAAALVADVEILSAFAKIVWVSVGQEPDIRGLQDSIHHQLTKTHFGDEVKSEADATTTLRDAAKGSKVLLVLDDVWDPKHEKPLNCIDPNSESRLLATTRIRGLLKNASEVDVGVLSQEEALKLLLASAEIDQDDMEVGTDEHRSAIEIVELCGRLPLTLAIAGGMVTDTGQGFNDDILEMMKETQELEDEEGMTVEARVISTSEKMMIKGAGKHKDLVGKVFRFFACFPEDVAVPAAVFNKMAPVLSDEKSEKKARLAVGICLGTLLKYNLLKGSLSAGSGVFMHDIVRDYVINQYSEDELRALQQCIIATLLAARPEPGGFVTPAFAGPETFEGYCARHMHWHFAGALEESEKPPDKWMRHPDEVILINVANSVGFDKLTAFSRVQEEAGDLFRAAEASWVAFHHGKCSLDEAADRLYNAARLLETANSDNGEDANVLFEKQVLKATNYCEMGSERHGRAASRLKLLGASVVTFETKYNEVRQLFLAVAKASGMFDGGGSLEELGICAQNMSRGWSEAAILSEDLSFKISYGKLGPACSTTMCLASFQFEQFSATSLNVVEEDIIAGIAFYDFEVCGPALKRITNMDVYQSGYFIPTLVLIFGNLASVDIWYAKTLASFQAIDLTTTKKYEDEVNALLCLQWATLPALAMLGRYDQIAVLLRALSFGLDAEFDERFQRYFDAANAAFSVLPFQALKTCMRLMLFISSSEGKADHADVNAWIPQPSELVELYNESKFFTNFNFIDLPNWGAEAFLKLGRDDDACEVARLVVTSEPKIEKKWILMHCHSILGQVAAKRGNPDEAESHFANALEEAKLSRLPMLEVLAARDWKKYLLEPNGGDASVVEAAIDGACAQMKKTREQMASVLKQ